MSKRQADAILVSILSVMFTAAAPANATTLTYSDFTSWNAAATGVQLINFDSVPTGPTSDILQLGVDFTGLTPSMSPSTTFQVFNTSLNMFMNFGTLRAIAVQAFPLASTPYIHIVLPTPVTAVGMNLFTYNSGAGTFQLTVNAQNYTASTFAVPTLAFWGITSDTPISSIDVGMVGPTDNQTYLLDNFRFGSASAPDPPPTDTPEAATFLLIGTGLIGLPVWNRRRKRSQVLTTLNSLPA